MKETGANSSVFFVPAAFVLDAFMQTTDVEIKPIIVVPENFSLASSSRAKERQASCRIIFVPGRVVIVPQSGSLSYDFTSILSEKKIAQSTAMDIAADPVMLRNLVDTLQLFQKYDGTDAIIIVGEADGEQEQKAPGFIHRRMTKPVASYTAGRHPPQGKRMGHASAVVHAGGGGFERAGGIEDRESHSARNPMHVAEWAAENNLSQRSIWNILLSQYVYGFPHRLADFNIARTRAFCGGIVS